MFDRIVLKKMMISALMLGISACALHLKAQTTTIDPDSVKGPVCLVRDTVRKCTYSISPEQSQYNVVITDGYARLELTQKFVNRYPDLNEIVYVFPLPHDGSVHAMSMQHNDSILVAEIFEKSQAQQIYDSVKTNGQTAALLLQDRPNVFQQRLANIPQGDSAYIRITVDMPLVYNAGRYELAIPTMIGERYQSNGAEPVPSSGWMWNPPEDRDGQTLQINVLLQTGFSIANLTSPTHALDAGTLGAMRALLEQRRLIKTDETPDLPHVTATVLKELATYPNRDFVLRFSRENAGTDFTFASHFNHAYSKGHFALNLFPADSLFADTTRPPLEIVMLVDISGSQGGWPLDKEKVIATTLLDKLRPIDRVCPMAFSDNNYWCFGSQTPVSAIKENVDSAKKWIAALSVLGGTQLLGGIDAALATPSSGELKRFYIFLTDGFITDEATILDHIENHPSKPTIFTFGAGNSLNRYFLDRCAAIGNGYATDITMYDPVVPRVEEAWAKIESPALENVAINYGGEAVFGSIIPGGTTLYKGSPLSVYGTYTTGGDRTITLTGYRSGQPVTIAKDVTFATGWNSSASLPQIWAKQMIEKLMIDQGVSESMKDSIIAVSKEYQVLSNYTAFLAVNPQAASSGNNLQEDMNGSFTGIARRLASASDLSIFVGGGHLRVSFPSSTDIAEITIYDLFGRVVMTLRPGIGETVDQFDWNGLTESGAHAATGYYVIRIKTVSGLMVSKSFMWKL